MMSRETAGNWLLFIVLVLLIAVLLVFNGAASAQEVATEAAPVIVTPMPDVPTIEPATPDTVISDFINRLDPNLFLVVLLIGGGLLALLNHLSKQTWISALRDSVPYWVREPAADALDGGSEILLDELERRAAETPETYDDEQVAQLRRRVDEVEAWIRGNTPVDAASVVKVNQNFPQV